jgi:hypothetical protein
MNKESTGCEEVRTLSLTRVQNTVVRADGAKAGIDLEEFVRSIQRFDAERGSLFAKLGNSPTMAIGGGRLWS